MTRDIKQFVEDNKLSMTCTPVNQNPNNKDWTDANHWKCILSNGSEEMTTYFSMGLGLHGEPTTEDLINAIAMDSYHLDEAFEDWCGNYGYDPLEDEKAKGIYEACIKNAEALKNLIGEDQFETLLYDTELL